MPPKQTREVFPEEEFEGARPLLLRNGLRTEKFSTAEGRTLVTLRKESWGNTDEV